MKPLKPIETGETCMMVLIEGADFELFWECTNCSTWRKATKNFETKKKCPYCSRTITDWIDFDGEGTA